MEQKKLHEQESTSTRKFDKILLAVLFLAISYSGYSQSSFSLGFSGGYDKSFNILDGITGARAQGVNYDKSPDYNFGIDGILRLNDHFRVRTEIHYANIGFTREYEYDIAPSSSTVTKSKVAISNLDIAPTFDCKLIKIGKFNMYATLGMRFEFELGKYERSFLANGDKSSNQYFNDFTTTQAGATGGFIFDYDLGNQFSIFLIPEYTYFFNTFNSKNTNTMQRATANIGLEYRF